MKALLDERRIKAAETAESELRAVSEGKIKLVQPATVAAPEQQAGGGSTIGLVSKPTRKVTQSGMSGLI
jgi:hypothetical protein